MAAFNFWTLINRLNISSTSTRVCSQALYTLFVLSHKHTGALYLQGSKHHHFLLRALNFLQQDGPLGLFIQLVHSDGIILGVNLSQMLTHNQTNTEQTQMNSL